VVLDVVTWTVPVVAPSGIAVVIAVPDALTVNTAAVPLKVTMVEQVNLLPRMITVSPTWAEGGMVLTKGPRLHLVCGSSTFQSAASFALPALGGWRFHAVYVSTIFSRVLVQIYIFFARDRCKDFYNILI
jgi:hypothetical protein